MPGDIPWRPCASRFAFEERAQLLADIRAFFTERKVMEVETPLLSKAGNSDPNILNISTDTSRKRYLRTSPEFPMKRLLSSGIRDIYELGRVFRAGEAGRHHNPEFTLLEWYRTGWSYLDLASEVIDLVRRCGKGRFDAWEENRITYRELFIEHSGLDPFHTDESELSNCAAERGIVADPMEQQDWLDLILSEVIQPALPGETLTIVYDYPPEQAALARIRPGAAPVAERFELYLGQLELANGYQELTDYNEQKIRFERENRLVRLRGDDTVPLDECLLAALQHGLPECSGVALGVDRLLMACLNLDNIDMVLAFPADRA
jgi:lysyl-tRNA synthetase class 2